MPITTTIHDDHPDDHLVGHEIASVHELLGAHAEVGARRDRCAEEIARGDVLQAVLIDDELALGALAGGWGAGDHDLLRDHSDRILEETVDSPERSQPHRL